mmetsp:Transcript_77164/g.136170  ORF Transcript_77164/g.136170 Transcript_77164/m.136170 type:complete len:144 (+) Transcript_77164:47-478(+)|eukprot:CAMPEP_0197650926 /NCGR_PEP_ID=MMETSP1338-20131121/31246_1 /TAXON_ID=43686 ORGANISM="Pelagodinium beii, Strain RCC1491" /NCGR_SAMPLE_ID=MMETSP1338 /ASSEMBLY_ACC=CAM_ASM_000754 /LENGTH=143 /DNA_ID=CAMNT_0043225445 /DNA_START=44 /DNA_END=475 /DNA_ORIENTATION=+
MAKLAGLTLLMGCFSAAATQTACTGDDMFPTDSERCFSATKFAVTFKGRLLMNATGGGSINFDISGLLNTECHSVSVHQEGQLMQLNQTALDECLPSIVALNEVSYCSNQEDLAIDFKRPLPIVIHLSQVPCEDERRLAALLI